MIIFYFSLLFICLLVLILVSDFLIKTVSLLAPKIKIPKFVLSSIFLAAVAAFPELTVGIVSAINHKPILALSNVLGSGLTDLTLVSGLAIVIGGGLFVKKKVILHELLIIFALALFPFILLLDRNLSFIDGLILLSAYFFYNAYLFFIKERRFIKEPIRTQKRTARLAGEFVFGLAALALAAQLVVLSAEKLTVLVRIPVTFVGLFLISLGTTLPEFVLELRAAEKRETGIFFGEVFGSVAAYITGILGVVAIISPIRLAEEKTFIICGVFIVIAMGVLAFFLRSERKITRRDGMVLIAIYLCFALAEFFFNK